MDLTAEQILLEKIRASDYMAFEELHGLYHRELLSLAIKKLGDLEQARDLLQDMFIELWEKRETFTISNPLQHYLRNRLWFKLSDHFRHKGFQQRQLSALAVYLAQEQAEVPDALEVHIVEEQYQLLTERIERAVEDMPVKMQQIFKLSRDEVYTIAEIADRLGLSRKTVSNQLNLSIKWIRRSLGDQPLTGFQLFVLISLTKL